MAQLLRFQVIIIKSTPNKNMSDDPKKKSEAAGKKKASSSIDSKPNVFH